jgi:hypothetical protein
MDESDVTKSWLQMERMVKDMTDADMVEAEITEHGHVKFEITFTNRSEDMVMNELLSNFE